MICNYGMMEGFLLALFLLCFVAVGTAFSIPKNVAWKSSRVGKGNQDFCLYSSTASSIVEIGELVGDGSYGTVHICSMEGKEWIGKRAWTKEEVQEKNDNPSEKAKRCEYYLNVEEHCFQKLGGENYQLPFYKGTYFDEKNRRWMLFDIIKQSSSLSASEGTTSLQHEIAPTLKELMKMSLKGRKQGNEDSHHLHYLQKALGIEGDDEKSLGETLDTFFDSLLNVLSSIHSKQIVHRDVKPDNLLVTTNSVCLIDFGSAADLEPLPGMRLLPKRVGMEDEQRVAVSPIYAAPELFVKLGREPLNFDVFSAALIYCQLLFNYLDERTDAGFHQQLGSCDWDLEQWLDNEMTSKLRPAGLDEALEVLAERPGLFRLLTDMLQEDPELRIRSDEALERFRNILVGEKVPGDGRFFEDVVETLELCPIIDFEEAQYRPLHFVGTFLRKDSLGLVLSEVDADAEDEDMDDVSKQQWIEATKDALPGQVFVKEVVEGGQADKLGIFEIGDQLQGVGELPLGEGGFERVVKLLEDQPRSSKYVTLHFDRKKSTRIIDDNTSKSGESEPVVPVDQGVWSTQGRRKYQEDKFILHEFQNAATGQSRSILVAGVMDGHGGDAASKLVSDMMPDLFSNYLFGEKQRRVPISLALEKSWETVCNNYQKLCTSEYCTADYDSREGRLYANTGAEDLVAGTTSSVAALDESDGQVTILNCGDSRTLIIDEAGKLVFQTSDHSPQFEIERLKKGVEEGLDYSIPKCSLSRWYVSVGKYQYALSRSLEGPFATSKGIISTPDMTTLQVKPKMTMVIATDGLFEVMDSDEVAHDIGFLRKGGKVAGDAAKCLCSMALERGTNDNVSVVVVYL